MTKARPARELPTIRQTALLLASFWVCFAGLTIQYLHRGTLWLGYHHTGALWWGSRALFGALLSGIMLVAWSHKRPLRWPLLFVVLCAGLGYEWVWAEGHIGLYLALVFTSLLPSLLFSWLTWHQTRAGWRTSLHGIYYSVVMLLLIPAACMEVTGGSWQVLSTYHSFWLKSLLQLVAIPAIWLIAASQTYALAGGTPMPYDPPQRLIYSGPFAYIANPMQVSKWVLLSSWGLVLQHVWVVVVAMLGLLYSVAIAEPREHIELPKRLGESWKLYRQHVRCWLPRWRPFHMSEFDSSVKPAQLSLDLGCSPCAKLADWLIQQQPRGITIQALQEPTRCGVWEMRYDAQDGTPPQHGLMALTSGIAHIHLGWAMLAWSIQFPLLCHVFQWIYEAVVEDINRH